MGSVFFALRRRDFPVLWKKEGVCLGKTDGMSTEKTGTDENFPEKRVLLRARARGDIRGGMHKSGEKK